MITCFFENNNKVSLRHVTVNAIVVKNNQVLLGKRGTVHGKPMLESGKWGLLGGFFARDENLVQAVKREVMEKIWNFFLNTLKKNLLFRYLDKYDMKRVEPILAYLSCIIFDYIFDNKTVCPHLKPI